MRFASRTTSRPAGESTCTGRNVSECGLHVRVNRNARLDAPFSTGLGTVSVRARASDETGRCERERRVRGGPTCPGQREKPGSVARSAHRSKAPGGNLQGRCDAQNAAGESDTGTWTRKDLVLERVQDLAERVGRRSIRRQPRRGHDCTASEVIARERVPLCEQRWNERAPWGNCANRAAELRSFLLSIAAAASHVTLYNSAGPRPPTLSRGRKCKHSERRAQTLASCSDYAMRFRSSVGLMRLA